MLYLETSPKCTPLTPQRPASHQITFPLVLGDNPWVSFGAPLAMGGKPLHRTTVDLSTYESYRAKRRRSGKKLKIPAGRREAYLLAAGYSLSTIIIAANASEKARKERVKSIQYKSWDRFALHLESARGKLKSFKLGSSQKLGEESKHLVSASSA